MRDEEIDEYEDLDNLTEDDTVIGRAFWISLSVIGLVGAAVGAVLWLRSRGDDAPPPQEIEVAGPGTVEREAELPTVSFTDITTEAGIDFVHESGARGDKLLPETMGGGCAFLDYDRDGDADLLLVNSMPWPGSDDPSAATQALYANDGSGQFEDVTVEAGLDLTFYGCGSAWADADCDGDVDLFFTAVGENRYLAQDAGRFSERDAGVTGASDTWSTAATFFDSDLDGDLDLFVGNYVSWSREIDYAMDYRLTGVGRAYGPPVNFEGTHPYLYENDGAGQFRDVSAESGVQITNSSTGKPVSKTLGVLPCDFDVDGDVDLVVANDTVQNFLFESQGDGTFLERAAEFGLAFDRSGKATGAMGIDGSWYRGPEEVAVGIGNFANEMSSLYVREPRSNLFLDEAIGEGFGAPSRKYLSFGVLFIDYDLDGRLDLLQANGHLESEISQVQSSMSYEQPAQLFWNAGADSRYTFIEVDANSSGDLSKPLVGRGLASADIDGDGDLDLLITQSGGAPRLLRNDQALGHHWLRLKLQGPACNPDGFGARVEVRTDEARVFEIAATRSYLAQLDGTLTVGLGSDEQASVSVRWPDGTTTEHGDLAADRVHVLAQAP